MTDKEKPTAKKVTAKKSAVTLESIEALFRKLIEELIPKPIDTTPTEYEFDFDHPNSYGGVPSVYAEKMRAQLNKEGHKDIAEELGTHYMWFNMPGASDEVKSQIRNNHNKWLLIFGQNSDNKRLAENFGYTHFHNGSQNMIPGTITALNLAATPQDVVNDIAHWVNKKLQFKQADAGGIDFSPVDPNA